MVREGSAHGVELLVGQSGEQARDDIARQLVRAIQRLAESCLLGTCIGNVSVRIPGTDTLLIGPGGPFLERPTADELVEITMNGRIVHRRRRPSVAQQMHVAIYEQRPDVQAIVHGHAPFATVLGLCGMPIPPVTIDSLPFTELPRVSFPNRLDNRWPQEVAAAVGDGVPAALLLHHGVVTVGANLQEAVRRALALEETARILVIACLLKQVPAALPAEAVDILKQLPL